MDLHRAVFGALLLLHCRATCSLITALTLRLSRLLALGTRRLAAAAHPLGTTARALLAPCSATLLAACLLLGGRRLVHIHGLAPCLLLAAAV